MNEDWLVVTFLTKKKANYAIIFWLFEGEKVFNKYLEE